MDLAKMTCYSNIFKFLLFIYLFESLKYIYISLSFIDVYHFFRPKKQHTFSQI